MGSMSASDAAPLPRLGEVYFDVRGESRSMRLSWYADTGVAVFSIWQGGTCTGTFRLPIADLPRMVDALQRGPHGAAGGDARDPRDARGTAAYREDQGGEHRRDGAHGRYDAPGEYEDEPTGVYRGDVAGHGYQDDPGAHYRDADYTGDPLTGRYPVADPHPAGYPEDDPHPPRYAEADPPRYQEDPLTGRYHEDPRPARYPGEEPHPARYPEGDSHSSRYREEDPRPAGYPEEDPRPAQYSADPLTGAYPDDPHSRDYPAGAGYPDGSAAYPEDTAGYPEDTAGYPEDTAGYPEDTAGYPEDTAGYPPSSRNDGYSPARPYVTPVPGSTGPAAEGRGHGRRRAADQEQSDLSPGSFPYGRPPAEPEPPRHGR
jgi:hypothetical protein